MLEAKACGSMNKGEGGRVETQGLREMAELSSVRRACDRRLGDVGRLWQDLNVAHAHFPRCVLEGPERASKSSSSTWFHFSSPRNLPLPHTA